MGMAAGQARLLSITARLSDNEQSGQAVSYSKQRLADETEQLNAAYLAALEATKLTVLTGFNGTDANYTDISYGLMTGFDTVACGKQYIITNNKGKVLVSQELANAFEKGNGDFNIFLAELGYTQSDIDNYIENDEANGDENYSLANQAVHEAWDKYLRSVGIIFEDDEHENGNADIVYGYSDNSGNFDLYGGYATYQIDSDGDGNLDGVLPLNYEGTTQEQRELYDYAVAITTELYNHINGGNSNRYNGKTLSNNNELEAGYISYYKNIFNKMSTAGYYTEAKEKDTIKDNNWFEQQLRDGKLLLQYYSTTEKSFVSTSISEDDAIQEVEDEREIARVETKYNQDLAALEKKDQNFDLELKKLDTEHSALQNEYDSVKNVIDKNVEKSFNAFS